MYPIVVGVAAVAAWVLSGCGDDAKLTQDLDNNDAGPDSPDDEGAAGSSGRGGAGGTSGTAGNAGVSGRGGAAGMDEDMDAGVEDAGPDAFNPDAAEQEEVAYHFGMIYGSNPFQGVNGTGSLFFSGQDRCQLLGGTFQAETQAGDQFGMSVDLTGHSGVDFCDSQIELPLSGGLFEGVTWMLDNKSNPLLAKEGYEILSCGSDADAGVGLENCSGALNISNE